jgi:hypothetical protein
VYSAAENSRSRSDTSHPGPVNSPADPHQSIFDLRNRPTAADGLCRTHGPPSLVEPCPRHAPREGGSSSCFTSAGSRVATQSAIAILKYRLPCSSEKTAHSERVNQGERISFPNRHPARNLPPEDCWLDHGNSVVLLSGVADRCRSSSIHRTIPSHRVSYAERAKECNILLPTAHRMRLKDELYALQPILQSFGGRNELRSRKTVVQISVEQGTFVVGGGTSGLQ